jgi:hypothetical protein
VKIGKWVINRHGIFKKGWGPSDLQLAEGSLMDKHYECSITLDFENVDSEEEAIAEFMDYLRNDASYDSVEVRLVP